MGNQFANTNQVETNNKLIDQQFCVFNIPPSISKVIYSYHVQCCIECYRVSTILKQYSKHFKDHIFRPQYIVCDVSDETKNMTKFVHAKFRKSKKSLPKSICVDILHHSISSEQMFFGIFYNVSFNERAWHNVNVGLCHDLLRHDISWADVMTSRLVHGTKNIFTFSDPQNEWVFNEVLNMIYLTLSKRYSAKLVSI